MAQQIYPISLKEASFPMLSNLQSRTVIGDTIGKAPSQDSRPAVAYCHNVMPTKEGYEAVSYLQVVNAVSPPAVLAFSDVRIIYGDQRSRIYLAWDTEGAVYSLLEGATDWISVPATSPATGGPGFSTDSVTVGTVNGLSYILYSGIGAFIYNEATDSLDAVTLVGLSIGTIKGIIESAGYLVAYTESAIAWSSTVDPTDFVPSSVTGAGGGNVAGIAGKILFITTNSLGMLIHTTANTLAGTFTGNVQFPWKFRVIPGGKGGISLDLIAYEAESNDQYVYSKAGLQSLSSQRADVILPEVTDFLAGKVFEDFNETTKQYEITDLVAPMKKKLKYISSRYLVISYGVTSFTHAIVIDTALQRMGKLKVTHADCFEYVGTQNEIVKEALAFLLADGSVKVLDISDAANSLGSGVLILGKLQGTYTRFITLIGAEVENVGSTSNLSLTVMQSLDGKTTSNTSASLAYSVDGLRNYVCRVTGKNHSLVLIGDFNVNTVLVRYFLTGRR